ncbi:Collagen alpha-1(XVIII) chain [Geodia barretti]|nr:Collagen alpha-1(XVIII) chain [Geodia barretti]
MGEKGDIGDVGEKGDTGDMGVEGQKGEMGVVGAKGEKGQAALMSVQIFDSFESLNASDLNLDVGSVAFVLDTAVMYILTEDGWTSALAAPRPDTASIGRRRKRDLHTSHRHFSASFHKQYLEQMKLRDQAKHMATCGNGVKEEGETCDAEDFGRETCQSSQGTMSIGKLACTEDCEIDTSSCQPLSLLMFALSEPLSGSAVSAQYPTLPSSLPPSPHLNTTLRADLACQLDARRLGLHGTYIAMLSASQRSLVNIIPSHYTSLPVVNTKGEVIAWSWTAMFSHPLNTAPLFTLHGEDIRSSKNWSGMWHGSTSEGAASHSDCLSWSSSSYTASGSATLFTDTRTNSNDNSNNILLEQIDVRCDRPLAVLCVLSSPVV